jgi:hypothetical protein
MTRTLRLLAPLVLALALGCTKEKLCSSDMTLCGNTCVKLDADRANCGACGRACGANEDCQASACVCPSPFALCNGACVDLASDVANCGACGNACTSGWVCTTPPGGPTGCALNCSAGQTACGDSCVDLLSQRANCGACGRACGSGERCTAGRCVADLYLACFNSDEVREATAALAPAGLPIDVAPGPIGLAWAGDLLAVASGKTGGAETLTLLAFDPPGLRQSKILTTSAAQPDVEYLAEHEGILYVSHNSSGTLLLVTPSGHVVDEVSLAPGGSTTNPNPQGIAFDGAARAYLALQASGEVLVLDVSRVSSCAAGTQTPPCTSEVARIDLAPLASPSATPMPARIAVDSGHAYVALWNLDAYWNPPLGSTGRVAAIRTDTATLDADFAGTANGLIDLGPGCLNAADVAVHGGKLYVTCGAFDYSNYPTVTIHGAGIVPVDLSGTVAQVLPPVSAAPDQAPGKLAFCGTTGYVGDRNSGRVTVFDPTSGATTLDAGVELCPPSNGYAYIADIACGR